MVGNPVRSAMMRIEPVEQRYQARRGPLRMLVIGGSLGAGALNDIVPAALASLGRDARPIVTHHTGENHLASGSQAYENTGGEEQCHEFIDARATALSETDVVICRTRSEEGQAG